MRKYQFGIATEGKDGKSNYHRTYENFRYDYEAEKNAESVARIWFMGGSYRGVSVEAVNTDNGEVVGFHEIGKFKR